MPALTEPAAATAFDHTDAPTLSLDRAAVGTTNTVIAVIGQRQVRRRLLEMGICPGTTMTVIRRAPMRDPVEFLVRGYHLSLRAEQARHVVVSATQSNSQPNT